MRKLSERSLRSAVIALLLLGIVAPTVAFGQLGASTRTQGQLAALVEVAQTSKAYATSTVDVAASHGLDVSAAQAQLAQGDSFLVAAQADAAAGTNVSAGILAVQTAMRDFTFAAAAASLALNNAHLTATVTYSAAAGAVAEVNASASVISSVTDQACGGGSAGVAGSSALTGACAQVKVDIASAFVQLRQAASLLAQVNGTASTNVDYSQVLSLVAGARAQVDATESGLATMAASTYPQRGQAFVTSVVLPLSAKANATVAAEQSFNTDIKNFQTAFSSYAGSQQSATQDVASSATALATAIAQVNTNAVTTSVSVAQSTEAQLNSDLQVLLVLPAITALPSVVADIQAAMAASTAYNIALSSANNWAGSFSQAQVSSYGDYFGTWNGDSAKAQSAGGTYLAAYQAVVFDLSTPLLQGLSQVQAVLALQVSPTVSAVDTSMQQATLAMGTVQTDIASMNTAIASAQANAPMSSSLVTSATSISNGGAIYLNATGTAAVAQVSASVQATANAATSFVASATSSTQSTLGAYGSTSAGLASGEASLNSQTQLSESAAASVAAYVNSDIQARTSQIASSQVQVSLALQLFSGMNVSGGATAMAQACLELQGASTLNA